MNASKITSKSTDISVATALEDAQALVQKVGVLGLNYTLDLNIWIEDKQGTSIRIDTRPKSDGITLA
jgi:hypothetical protein